MVIDNFIKVIVVKNTHSLNLEAGSVEGAYITIVNKSGGDLTITGNGRIVAKKDDCYGVDARDGGKLVIENTEIIGNVTAVYSYEGDVEIRSGTFSIEQLSENFGHKLLINLYDQNRDAGKTTLKVYGGTYVGFDPANPMENGYKLLPEGYTSTLVDEATNTYKVTMS